MVCYDGALPLSFAEKTASVAWTNDGKFGNFVPAGYWIDTEIKGDLNNDGLEDYVLQIIGPKKVTIHNECWDGPKCSRGGIIIVFNKGDSFELAMENRDCFTTTDKNDDDCSWECGYGITVCEVSINKGNLYLGYANGNNGYWYYTFRYQNSDFELIGYDHTAKVGPCEINTIESINFLTKKRLTKKNIKDVCDECNACDVDDVFEEKWESFTIEKPIKLREIENVDFFYPNIKIKE